MARVKKIKIKGFTIIDNDIINELAQKYHKTPSQICLRYIYQNDILPLPKSVTPSRIQENINIFDFEIGKADMDRLDALKVDYELQDPDTMER